MANYLTPLEPFDQWQLARYGNILNEKPEPVEEFEYLNMENREVSEWIEKQAEDQLQENQN